MSRIELLLGLNNNLAPAVAQRIGDGEYPAVSMGCRIRFDRCNICAHKAPTRKDYCEHLKFSMRQVMPSGLRAGALNPAPKWFDISFVIRPADLTGFMMKKVADEQPYQLRSSAALGDYLDNYEEKRAAIRKIADIDKIVRGLAVDHKVSPLTEPEALNIQRYRDMVLPAVQGMPDLDDTTIGKLSKFPVAQVLSTLSAAGVILTTPEFVKMIVERLAPGTQIPEHVLDGIVAMQGHIFDLFAEHPQLLEQLGETGMFDRTPSNVNPEIGVIAEKYLEKRSTIGDYLSRKLLPPQLREDEPKWTEMLHVSDPATGQQYQTTRGAARSAHDEIAKKQLMKLVGTGALLAGGGRLTASLVPQAYQPLTWATTGIIGAHALRPNYGPQYLTDEGVPIPTLTELQKVSSAGNVGLPILGSAALVAALGHDYVSRLHRGEDVNDPNAPLHKRIFNRLGEFYNANPMMGMLGNLAVYGGAKHMLNKFSAVDSVTAPEIDIDAVVEKIGSLLLP